MWRKRYNKEFKYPEKNMFITAIQTFPNMHTTVQHMKDYFKVEENQKDHIRREIDAMTSLDNGRNFIPVMFEDQEPKLLDFKEIEDFGGEKGWFWCVAYRTPCVTIRNEHSSSIMYPSHKEFREYLEYSLSNLNGMDAEWLFEQCVKKWVYEQTSHFTDEAKSRRFYHIENTGLMSLSHQRHRFCHDSRLPKERYLQFLDLMYQRDIYEFMFNEFKFRVC